jgi:hypothetical protein
VGRLRLKSITAFQLPRRIFRKKPKKVALEPTQPTNTVWTVADDVNYLSLGYSTPPSPPEVRILKIKLLR